MPHIKIEGLLLKVDGSTEVIDINDRNKPLKGYVDGWIQCVDAPSLGISFVIDEEGKLKEKPVNQVATVMWSADIHNRGGILDDYFVGDVVIVNHKTTRNGEWTSLSQKQIDELLLKIPPLVEVMNQLKEKDNANG